MSVVSFSLQSARVAVARARVRAAWSRAMNFAVAQCPESPVVLRVKLPAGGKSSHERARGGENFEEPKPTI